MYHTFLFEDAETFIDSIPVKDRVFLQDRVVVKMVEAEETTKSGIILTNAAKEKPQIAEIIEVGPGGIVDGKEVKGVYIHYLTPEDFDARKKHNLKLKFSFTPKVAEVDKDKKELKVTLIRIIHPHYKAVPGYVALGPAIHSSSVAYGFTCKVKAPIETIKGLSKLLEEKEQSEYLKKYLKILNDEIKRLKGEVIIDCYNMDCYK